MECWACGEELAEGEVVYDERDETQRYPLCIVCDKTVDVRLLVVERIESIEV